MKIVVLALCVLLTAVSASGAGRVFDITGWASWVDPQSSDTFNSANPNRPFGVSFNGKLGYGAGVNLNFGSTSLGIDAVEVRPQAQFGFPGATLNQGDLKMIPITGVLRFHFLKVGPVDPYIGGGAAYVLFDNIKSVADIGHVGVNQINFKDDVGFVANAGLGINITPNFGITFDGKYVPLRTSATAVFVTGPNQSQKIKINPVIGSVGLTLRF